MRPAPRPRCLVFMALLAGSLHLRAEPLGPVEVEVIVFRYRAAANGQEWTTAASLAPQAAVQLAAAPLAGLGEVADFTAYATPDLRLTGVAQALNRAGAYEVLAHTAWRQPAAAGLAVSLAPPLDAQAPALAPSLQGALRLRPAGADLRVDVDLLVPAGEQQVAVHAQQNVRPGELRYLDHPLAGVLLQIRPWLAATSEPPAGTPNPTPTPAPRPGPAD